MNEEQQGRKSRGFKHKPSEPMIVYDIEHLPDGSVSIFGPYRCRLKPIEF